MNEHERRVNESLKSNKKYHPENEANFAYQNLNPVGEVIPDSENQ